MERYSAAEICMCRQFAGLTQAQAAKIAGVSRNTWNRYERGHRPMPQRVRKRCSRFMSDDPLQMRRAELVKLMIYACDSGAELKEQLRRFVDEALTAWRDDKEYYRDEHGRIVRNPNFKSQPKKDSTDEQG